MNLIDNYGSFVYNPPIIVFDYLFCALDDRVEVVLVWVVLAVIGLGFEESILEDFQEFQFDGRQIRMPEIDNKNQPRLLALMPSLMLKRIIKNISLPFLLLPRLIAHSHAATFNAHQRQMESQFFIRRTVVFHDMGFRCQSAEECVMVIVGDVLVD